MQHLGKWAAGIIGGVLALAVLFYAANTTSAGTYNSALFLFVILIVFVFAQIKRGFDQAYKTGAEGTQASGQTGGQSGGQKGGGQKSGGKSSGGKSASAKSSSAKSASTSAGTSGQGATSAARSASASNAAKTGLSESAPSGPTNGTGAKH